MDPTTYVSIGMFKYVLGILAGTLRADAAAMHDTVEALATAQRCSEDFALHMAQLSRGVALVSTNSTDAASGFELLAAARSAALNEDSYGQRWQSSTSKPRWAKASTEDLDGALELARHASPSSSKPGRRYM